MAEQINHFQVYKLGGGEPKDHPLVRKVEVKAIEKIIGASYETWNVYMKDGREFFTQSQHIV